MRSVPDLKNRGLAKSSCFTNC